MVAYFIALITDIMTQTVYLVDYSTHFVANTMV